MTSHKIIYTKAEIIFSKKKKNLHLYVYLPKTKSKLVI